MNKEKLMRLVSASLIVISLLLVSLSLSLALVINVFPKIIHTGDYDKVALTVDQTCYYNL